jgi:hypothetical protein
MSDIPYFGRERALDSVRSFTVPGYIFTLAFSTRRISSPKIFATFREITSIDTSAIGLCVPILHDNRLSKMIIHMACAASVHTHLIRYPICPPPSVPPTHTTHIVCQHTPQCLMIPPTLTNTPCEFLGTTVCMRAASSGLSGAHRVS